jgi:bisphosphoglycerate-dependent phosphoglycerate mutase
MKRFKNGCVLKMEVTRLTITFELVYSGEVSKIKPGYEYYISPNDTQVNGTTLFDIEDFTIPNNFYKVEDNERFIFYLIRHGEASHNVKKGLSKMFQSISGEKDTSLTSEGIEQAKKIYENIMEKEENLTNPTLETLYLFSSDLKRTRQTMSNFISNLFNKDTIDMSDLIVLPCAHELNYKKDGNCDGSQGFSANENIMNCHSSRQECQSQDEYNVNWDLYEKFYDGTRTKSGSGKQQCRNTDMIEQAIEYIKTNPIREAPDDYQINGSGGGRNKRHRLQNKPFAPIPATSPLRTATLVVNTLTKRNRNNKKTKRKIIKKNKKTRKQRKQRKQIK